MDKKDDFEQMLFLPYLLNQAAEESSLSFQNYYKSHFGLLRTEWRVLFHLGMYGAMTAREICLRAKLHKTKVSRAVSGLEKRRYLKREPVQTDRRSEILHLLPAGRAVYDNLTSVAREHDAKLTQSFSESEIALLRDMLARLAGLPNA